MLRRLICCRTHVAALATAGACALISVPAHAQLPGVNPFSFGVEAGPVFPVRSFRNDVNTGFTVDALVEARLPVLPVGLRFEGGYTRFGIKNTTDHVRVISGSANVVYRLSPIALTLVRPYLIGGVGIYNVSQDRGTKAGVNIGGGVAVPVVAVTAFADARFTEIFADQPRINTIPIRFGVRF